MDIRLTVGGAQLRGSLAANETAQDLAALLPLTLTLTNFAASERIGDLPRRLDTSTAPSGAAGRPGDLAYYAPWGTLAIFYQASAYAPGLVHLGALEPGAVRLLAGLTRPATATIDALPTGQGAS